MQHLANVLMSRPGALGVQVKAEPGEVRPRHQHAQTRLPILIIRRCKQTQNMLGLRSTQPTQPARHLLTF